LFGAIGFLLQGTPWEDAMKNRQKKQKNSDVGGFGNVCIPGVRFHAGSKAVRSTSLLELER